MAFKGWPRALIEFYDELEVHNTKAWWEAHKATYEQDVKAPMEALLEELRGEFGEAKLFRPYRDIRFSKDKTPYKLECAATIRDPKGGGYYLRVSAGGLGAGGGMFHFDAGQLERYRAAVDQSRSGGELAKLVAELEKGGYALYGEESLETVPRGFPKDHPRGDLLKRKGVIWFRDTSAKGVVHSAKARDWVTETLRAGSGMATWLRKHVGPGTEPFGRGR